MKQSTQDKIRTLKNKLKEKERLINETAKLHKELSKEVVEQILEEIEKRGGVVDISGMHELPYGYKEYIQALDDKGYIHVKSVHETHPHCNSEYSNLYLMHKVKGKLGYIHYKYGATILNYIKSKKK